METYWLSFRLKDDQTYDRRYEALSQAIRFRTDKWWIEPSAFFLFRSASTIDQLAQAVRDAIDPSKDLAIIGMSNIKACRIVGDNQDTDVFELVPFAKMS